MSFSPGFHPRFFERGPLSLEGGCLGGFLLGRRRRNGCVNVDAENGGEVGGSQAGVAGLTLRQGCGGPRVHDQFLVVHFS